MAQMRFPFYQHNQQVDLVIVNDMISRCKYLLNTARGSLVDNQANRDIINQLEKFTAKLNIFLTPGFNKLNFHVTHYCPFNRSDRTVNIKNMDDLTSFGNGVITKYTNYIYSQLRIHQENDAGSNSEDSTPRYGYLDDDQHHANDSGSGPSTPRRG